MGSGDGIERPWDAPKEPVPGGSSWLVANRKYVIAVVAALAVVFLVVSNLSAGDEPVASSSGGSSSSASSSMSLSEAFCSDLRSGLTPMNILGGSVKDGTYSAQEAADLAYGFAALSCPEQLQSNEGLRVYLEGWGIDPDA